jgi:hypothetical protein
LVYQLRTSKATVMPLTNNGWDNDNDSIGTTAGAFYYQEWSTSVNPVKPIISTVLGNKFGSGNPEGLGGVVNGINVRYAHIRIRLTNNRSHV